MEHTRHHAANWVAVASADHVARGLALGIMQVGHGKSAPLRRLHAGDRVAYYSPVRRFGEKTRPQADDIRRPPPEGVSKLGSGPAFARGACQAFTALGIVRDGRVYQADMGDGFVPFRREVDYLPAHEAAIHPLLEALSFTCGHKNWGYAFRFGLLKVTDEDMALIARAMQAVLPAPVPASAPFPAPAAA